MSILYFVIPLLLALLFLVGYALWWSRKSGLFDNLEGPRHWCVHQDKDLKGKTTEPLEK